MHEREAALDDKRPDRELMSVYIPFDDGSSVAYDGKKFIVHRQPVDIDADVYSLSESLAERAWRGRRKELVSALETAWRKRQAQHKEKDMKRVYTKPPVFQLEDQVEDA